MARPKKQIRKQRADGTFEAKVTVGYTVDGKAVRKSFYSSKSYEDAKLKGERYKIQKEIEEKRNDIIEGKVTFEYIAEEVIKIKQLQVRTDTFEIHYNHILNRHIIPYFKKFYIQDIRRKDIENYFLLKKDMSVSTLKNHRGVLRTIFQYALEHRYIRVNPAEQFRIPAGKKEKEKTILNSEQMELLLKVCKEECTYITVGIYLQAQYGLSKAEVLGLKYTDIDIENKTITIQRDVVYTAGSICIEDVKTKYRNRVVVLSQETIDIIFSDPHCNTKEYIVSPDGNVYSPKRYIYHFSEIMKRYNALYELPIVTPHALRHSRASIWVAENKNLYAIANQLGWSDLEMLIQRYGHPDLVAIRKQLDL